jgi:hypothetical protein
MRSWYSWIKQKTINCRITWYFSTITLDNPFSPVAEDSIYTISTRNKSLSQYLSFISLFPSNRNVNKAWSHVYRLETPVYKYETFKKFSEKYPAFPNKQALANDLDLSTKVYLPFQKDSLYGYIDSASSKIKITPTFTEAAPFSEGMAAVMVPCGKEICPYLYINMEGTTITNYPWSEANDFHHGRALAAIGNCENDSCRYGFINRFGEWIIAPDFSDAFEFTDGLALVRKENTGYGYIDEAGVVVIPMEYGDAFTFSEGVAAVQSRDSSKLYGFIDRFGKWAVLPRFSGSRIVFRIPRHRLLMIKNCGAILIIRATGLLNLNLNLLFHF